MKALIQVVKKSHVSVDSNIVSSIGNGLCVLVGVFNDDTKEDMQYIVKKILNTRLFENNGKRWDLSVVDKKFEILCVSQFTLCYKFKGNKLTFHEAMETERSKIFWAEFLEEMKKQYDPSKIFDGVFGAHMDVHIENNGPITIEIDSKKIKNS